MQEKRKFSGNSSCHPRLLPPPVTGIAQGRKLEPFESSFTLAKIPYLMLPLERDIVEVPYLKRLTVEQATAGIRADLARLGYTRLVVSQNGYRLTDLSVPVCPGDFLAVSIYIGEDVARIIGTVALMVAAVAAGQVWGAGLAGFLGTSAGFAQSMIGMVVMIGGGMLLNTFLPAPTSSLPQTVNDKPTYSFDSFRNIVKAGLPLPVVYGHIASAPTVIGTYRWVDMAPADGSYWLAGDNNSMWVFFLLACAVGETAIPISN
ncbi:MAG: hypothetical protein LLG06_06475, partial [Desulfobacteraceae bacterium]|nr:hypothetical protein [Desulfobacteraceae bacterium]